MLVRLVLTARWRHLRRFSRSRPDESDGDVLREEVITGTTLPSSRPISFSIIALGGRGASAGPRARMTTGPRFCLGTRNSERVVRSSHCFPMAARPWQALQNSRNELHHAPERTVDAPRRWLYSGQPAALCDRAARQYLVQVLESALYMEFFVQRVV